MNNQQWSDKKPTEPGEYMVRWSKKHDPRRAVDEERVTVTRKGRGLSVYCSKYNDRVPMSQMADMPTSTEQPTGCRYRKDRNEANHSILVIRNGYRNGVCMG